MCVRECVSECVRERVCVCVNVCMCVYRMNGLLKGLFSHKMLPHTKLQACIVCKHAFIHCPVSKLCNGVQ